MLPAALRSTAGHGGSSDGNGSPKVLQQELV